MAQPGIPCRALRDAWPRSLDVLRVGAVHDDGEHPSVLRPEFVERDSGDSGALPELRELVGLRSPSAETSTTAAPRFAAIRPLARQFGRCADVGVVGAEDDEDIASGFGVGNATDDEPHRLIGLVMKMLVIRGHAVLVGKARVCVLQKGRKDAVVFFVGADNGPEYSDPFSGAGKFFDESDGYRRLPRLPLG